MPVDLNIDEIRILRALLIGDQQNVKGLSQATRERIVLKLHTALESANEEAISAHCSTDRVQ